MAHPIRPGFHAGGLAHHDPAQVIEELASLGFADVAVRPSAVWLDVRRPDFVDRWSEIVTASTRCGVGLILDMDSPYLHHPHQPGGPSLVADEPSERLAARAWLTRWCDQVGESVRCVTFRSGRLGSDASMDWIGECLSSVMDAVESTDAAVAIRPVAGDAIATVNQYATLSRWIGEDRLYLAGDVGEMIAAGEFPIGDRLVRCLSDLRCVYVCDRGGAVRDNLGGEGGGEGLGDVRIGSGEVATQRIIQTLGRSGYEGSAVYRVLGHPDDGLVPAREAIASFETARM